MKEQILEVYNLGLEKYAGDTEKAKEFTVGFLKEASGADLPLKFMDAVFQGNALKGIATGIGAGVAGLGLGLAVHGMSSMFNNASTAILHAKFIKAVDTAAQHNALLSNADRSKINSYAETIFKFAPHVATDVNMLSSILANAVHGEGLDPMTIRTLTDLEARIQETRKNALFSPKAYTK
jgi:hypothetical protein